jgi:predicted TIM-barrel fold metal-dependent hydrolase
MAAQRIDVHHHFYPPEYLAAQQEFAKRRGGGVLPGVRNWTVAGTVDEMDRNGVSTSILSISSTPVWFGADIAGMRHMARLCNDYAARMAQDHPGRFGLFASLPMPDVEGSLREIEYALDVLKADGIGIMTSFGDKWPGDKLYAPVLEELDRRKATLYLHPLAPNCCMGNLIPGVPESLIEYPHDSTRAILSLLFSGSFARFKNIGWLFSHGGGTIPMLAGRIATLSQHRKDLAEIAPQGFEYELRRLHYETANAAYRPSLAALLALVPLSQVMFGSDFPFVTIAENVAGLHSSGLTAEQIAAIETGNALDFLPRLRG